MTSRTAASLNSGENFLRLLGTIHSDLFTPFYWGPLSGMNRAPQRPSGLLRCPPEVTLAPVNAVWVRVEAFGIAEMRLDAVSATYSVLPWRPRVSPVGPTTRAAGSVCSAKPDPITTGRDATGRLSSPRGRRNRIRTTVPRLTTAPPAATVPFRTLVTNRSAVLPFSDAVMSQGPLMALPVMVSRTRPRDHHRQG